MRLDAFMLGREHMAAVCTYIHMALPEAKAHAAASVKIMYEPQPTPRKISALSEKTIRAVACGHNHTLALDTEQAAYTWGGPPLAPTPT